MRPGREVNYSGHLIMRLRIIGAMPPLFYVFTDCCSLKHRENFNNSRCPPLNEDNKIDLATTKSITNTHREKKLQKKTGDRPLKYYGN